MVRRPEVREAFHVIWQQGCLTASLSCRIIYCGLKAEDIPVSWWELAACLLWPLSACKTQYFFLPPVLGMLPAWWQGQWLFHQLRWEPMSPRQRHRWLWESAGVLSFPRPCAAVKRRVIFKTYPLLSFSSCLIVTYPSILKFRQCNI